MTNVYLLLAVVSALCAGVQSAASLDLVNGSPVSATVQFDTTQSFGRQTLSPVVVSLTGGTIGRRHLLGALQPSNMTAMPGAAEALRRIKTGSNTNSSAAGRHLLQAAIPTTFHVPISLKESALGGFVSSAFDFSGADATAFLTFISQLRFQFGQFSEAAANVQIVVVTDISSTTADIVDIISPGFFLDSNGKGRMEKFGIGADISTVQSYTAVNNGATSGAEIFLGVEIQDFDPVFGLTTSVILVPATDFSVEKASFPTAHGILDTLC